MAFEEDVVRRNPFDFVITKYVPNDAKRREALTPKELATWMDFIKNDRTYRKYYDEFIVLLGTGIRVSEFCGLTEKDLDFKDALQNILKNRPKLREELVIDGYSGFILLDKQLQPKVALHIENECRWALKKYKKLHPEEPLPHITPRVYRHTFCTNMVNAGMDVKVLQYIMGHSEIDVTLNIYTHMNFDRAAAQMIQLVDGKPSEKDDTSGNV